MKKHLTTLILALALVSTASATQWRQHESERGRPQKYDSDRVESRQGTRCANVPEGGSTLPLMAMGLGVLFVVSRNRGKTVNSL